MFRPLSILVGLFLSLGGVRADEALAPARALEQAMQEAIKKAEPSIVCILVSRSTRYGRFGAAPVAGEPGRLGGFDAARGLVGRRPQSERDRQIKALDLSDPDNTPESYGSGVVLDRSGLVLTNAHVVRGATKVFVRLPGGTGRYADIHALDTRSDLAVLRLIGKVPGLKELSLGDGDTLHKGQFVIALANPFAAGFRDGSPSASFGIVSNLRRRMPGKTDEIERNRLCLHQFGTLVQTDARLQAGCSGGALLNLKGELVGLTTSLAALEGVETPGGYALPMSAGLRRIIEVLRRGEEVEYGFLGVRFQPFEQGGVCLQKVIGNSGARQAGLRGGDYILAIDGKPVRHFDDVYLTVGMLQAGSTVEVVRARRPRGPGEKVLVKLSKYYVPLPSIASRRPPARGGLRVDYTSLLAQTGRDLDPIPEGVMIREVLPGSAADKAGLQPLRVITRVDGHKVTSPAEYYRAVAAAHGEVVLTLLKPEGPGTQQVKLRLD
jgi:S1-C subfamily serine protease